MDITDYHVFRGQAGTVFTVDDGRSGGSVQDARSFRSGGDSKRLDRRHETMSGSGAADTVC